MAATKGNQMSNDIEPPKTGYANLFLPTIIVLDLVGTLMAYLGPHTKILWAACLAGLACGLASGGYIYFRANLITNRSLTYLLVLGGLVGIAVPVFIAF